MLGTDPDCGAHVTSTDLIDERRATDKIPQSIQRFVAQGGSLQRIDVGYAGFDRVVAEPNVPGQRAAAQVRRRTRRYEVVSRLGL